MLRTCNGFLYFHPSSNHFQPECVVCVTHLYMFIVFFYIFICTAGLYQFRLESFKLLFCSHSKFTLPNLKCLLMLSAAADTFAYLCYLTEEARLTLKHTHIYIIVVSVATLPLPFCFSYNHMWLCGWVTFFVPLLLCRFIWTPHL